MLLFVISKREAGEQSPKRAERELHTAPTPVPPHATFYFGNQARISVQASCCCDLNFFPRVQVFIAAELFQTKIAYSDCQG